MAITVPVLCKHRITALTLGLTVVFAALLGCGPGADQQRRDGYVAANPQLDATTRSYIQSGTVVPGMTKDEVLAAWGSPPSNCPSWNSNLMEIWDYCQHPGRTLVMFNRHGRVAKIQP
jgi:hypothetical protein